MLLPVAMLALCGDCHPRIAKQWADSPMARSSGTVNGATEPTGAFFDESSRTRFEIRRARGRLELAWAGHFVDRAQRPTCGPCAQQALDFYIGSGRMGRSYGFAEDGYFYQAPVGYYALRGAWDMAPGYEHDSRPDLNRPVTAECLFCHASGMRTVGGTLNGFQHPDGLHGITCERCHGEGGEHAAHPRADNIVNPARLSGPKRDSVCEQCHLSGVARLEISGRRLTGFRPGDDLADYVAVFVAAPGGSVRVNSHAEALARSRCRQTSGERLWCGSCHDPHGPATAAAADYNRVCATCHQPGECPAAAKAAARDRSGGCIGCHMPKSRAADGGHTVFTDHSIPRRARKRESGRAADLEPYFTRSRESGNARNLGLAYAEAGRKLDRPDWLERAWPLLREAAIEGGRDAALYAEIGRFLDAAGRAEEAIRYYRLAIETDGSQFDALVNLARLLERKGEKVEAAALRERAVRACPRCVNGER